MPVARMPKLPPMAKLPPAPPLPGSRKKTKPKIGDGAATEAERLDAYTEEARERFKRDNAKMRDDEKRFRNATDSEYWVAFCFETREQKEEFLGLFKLLALGDKYVDGIEASRIMGKPLKSERPQWRKPKDNARWGAFVR